ncbi:MAG: CHAT domain-containing protein [Chitinophagales bacterium]|nr:CHAT domain-containing protein [Chitinophagales bacterium]
MRFTFIFLLGCLTTALQAQQQSEAYRLVRRADSLNARAFCAEALELAQQAINLLNKEGIQDTTTYANALAIEAWTMYQLSNDDATDRLALQKGTQAFYLRKKARRTEDHPDVADSYYFLGTVRGNLLGDPNAINFIQSGLAIYKKFRKPYEWDVVRGERFMAFQYTWGENKNPEKAINYIKNSLNLILKNPQREAWQVGRIMQGMGDVYSSIKYDTSLVYYPKALEQYRLAGFNNRHQWVIQASGALKKTQKKQHADRHLILANDLIDAGKLQAAKASVDTMLNYFRNYPEPEHKAYAYSVKGHWHLRNYDLLKARQYLDTAIILSAPLMRYELMKAYQAIDTAIQLSSQPLFNQGDSYYLLSYYALQSTIMSLLGDAQLSKIYAQASVSHYNKIDSFIDKHQKPEAMIRQAALMKMLNMKPIDITTLLHKGLLLTDDIGRDSYYINPAYTKREMQYNIYTLLAQVYENTQQDSAIYYYFKALDISKTLYTPVDLNMPSGNTYVMIASFYNRYRDFEKAIEYQRKALQCFERSEGGDTNVQTAATLNALATGLEVYYTKQGKAYNASKKTFIPEYDSISILLNRVLKGMQQSVKSKTETTFHKIALQLANMNLSQHYFFRYQFSGDKSYLETARRYCDAAMQVFKGDAVFQNLARVDELDLRPAYAQAATLYAQFYKVFGLRADAEKAFQYAELSKAAQLRVGLQDRSGKYEFIPDSVLDKEYELRAKISGYSQLGNTDSVLVYSLQLETLVKYMEEKYKGYYEIKYDNSIPNIQEVQKTLLDKDQTLIEYVSSGDTWYAFVIRPDTFLLIDLGSQPDVNDRANQLYKAMRLTCEKDAKSLQRLGVAKPPFVELSADYNEAAYELYLRFFKPLESWLDTGSRVIIVPVGALCKVPFALLQSKMAEKKDIMSSKADYLVKKYAFSYDYSAKLLKLVKTMPGKKNPQLLPFASFGPDYQAPWEPLPESKASAEKIASIYKVKAIIGEEATAALFLHMVEHLRVFLFSGHADAHLTEGDSCQLVFSKPKKSYTIQQLKGELNKYNISSGGTLTKSDLLRTSVFVRDLYNLRMDCELAVLSACLSAQGQDDGLEGIVSLSRAFTFAGTRCVVSTLWEALDKQSNSLIEYFFENLNKGMTKDRALRKAQLRVLGEGLGLPCSWGSFIVVGDTKSIQVK